jgi:RNA polymerase sigma factor for flagellar operon FliA
MAQMDYSRRGAEGPSSSRHGLKVEAAVKRDTTDTENLVVLPMNSAAAAPVAVLDRDSQVTSSVQEVDTDELVRQTLPLVGHIVRDMATRVPGHVAREDLMSAGMMALAQAAAAYDPARGVKFSSYAATRIRGAIVDELRSLDWASRSVRRRARQVDEARNTLAVTLGRVATDAEVAAALGMGTSELAAHQDDLSRASVMSLDGFEDGTAEDLLPSAGPTPLDVLEDRERLAYLHDAVDQLPERLRTVVRGYFFAERPMAAIAAELGVTDSRISQLRAEAVQLLRGALTANLDTQLHAEPAKPQGCAARRKEAYYASVASHRSFASRLTQTASAVVATA